MTAKHELVVSVFVTLLAAGCGGASGHPDTGAGAHQPVPAVEHCADLCQRFGDCAVILCNEDTKSTRYQTLGDAIVADCMFTCSDATVMTLVAPDKWTCFFESSCRQVFEYHSCDGDAYYRCS